MRLRVLVLGFAALAVAASALAVVPMREPGPAPAAADPLPAEPEPWLHVVLLGPERGTDEADEIESLRGRATGEYLTVARASGHRRLSGLISFAPSVCSVCRLETPYGVTEERGLLAVQYSFAARGNETAVRLSGQVDWEVEFEYGPLVADDPLGPPRARANMTFLHEAKASRDDGPTRSAHVRAPVLVEYALVAGEAPELPVRLVEKRFEGGWLRLAYA